MRRNYSIQFLSDWHCGSGLTSGADTDAETLKDESGLPYIPGKTIKGLFKDALMEMPTNSASISPERINAIFGSEIKAGEQVLKTVPGYAFFSNAEITNDEKEDLRNGLSDYLFRKIASTAIEKNGIAKESSLRTIQVCMPIVLHGYIDGILDEDIELIRMAAKWVRHIGVNRNRGLGRCKIII